MQSMTGFGSLTTTLAQGVAKIPLSLTLTLKTLNARFFEVTCRLPYGFSVLEVELHKRFRASLHRGSVSCSVFVHNPNAVKAEVVPSLSVVKGYVAAAADIQREYNVTGTLSISDIMILPGVFEPPVEAISEETQRAFLEIIDQLIQQVVAHRISEGAALARELHERAERMRQLHAQIEARAVVVMAERRTHLETEAARLLQTLPVQEREHFVGQIFHQLEKIDIHEEIARFAMHLSRLKTTIDAADIEKGKKIDFVLQELFRETNTINAKCADGQLSEYAISLKIELEKSRELVQNIV